MCIRDRSGVVYTEESIQKLAAFLEAKSADVLEAGSYVFYVGNNVRDAKKLDFTYDLAEAKVTAQYTSLAAPHKLSLIHISNNRNERGDCGI